jgi:hypothetical protein
LVVEDFQWCHDRGTAEGFYPFGNGQDTVRTPMNAIFSLTGRRWIRIMPVLRFSVLTLGGTFGRSPLWRPGK